MQLLAVGDTTKLLLSFQLQYYWIRLKMNRLLSQQFYRGFEEHGLKFNPKFRLTSCISLVSGLLIQIVLNSDQCKNFRARNIFLARKENQYDTIL